MPIEFAQILRDAGCVVDENPGWRSAGHGGAFTPIGVVWHHTAGLNALPVVTNGRADLAGPLCNLYLDHTGRYTVVSGGLAWHAGPGSQHVLDNVRAGIPPTADASTLGLVDDCGIGNEMFVGIEVENLGDGSPYPPAQIDALIAGTAALCKHLGVDETHCIHHREWTARKQDMSYRGDLRGAVKTALTPGADMPLSAADLAHIATLIKASQDVIILHIRPAVLAEVDKQIADLETKLAAKGNI